jgi:hypothetical protein
VQQSGPALSAAALPDPRATLWGCGLFCYGQAGMTRRPQSAREAGVDRREPGLEDEGLVLPGTSAHPKARSGGFAHMDV